MCCLIYKFLLILTQKMQISFLKILPENALKFVSKKMRICVKNFAQLQERLAELQMQQMDTALATDYEKLTELEQAIAAEQSNQESILDRLVETETELDEMQEKTV